MMILRSLLNLLLCRFLRIEIAKWSILESSCGRSSFFRTCKTTPYARTLCIIIKLLYDFPLIAPHLQNGSSHLPLLILPRRRFPCSLNPLLCILARRRFVGCSRSILLSLLCLRVAACSLGEPSG